MDSRVLYASDVIAQILHQEPTACYVKWYASQSMPNTKKCSEEQKLSILTQQQYLPRCKINNSTLYDGCQCNLSTLMCWCVDLQGNILDGQATPIPSGLTWQQVCVIGLQCKNSDVQISNVTLRR